MKKILLITIAFVALSSCFSAKGLPIKEKPAQTSENKPATASENEVEITLENDNNKELTSDGMELKHAYKAIVDHSQWDELIKKYVADNGDVNYKGFQKDSVKLNAYIADLSTQVPNKNWSIQEQLAYFINVYNANTIKLIIDNYPTKSIKDISNPWLKNRIKIGDKAYSLADIENGILRKMNDPRIHFAINCASVSCPKLMNTAYNADNVEALLNKAAIEFINNPDKNKLTENTAKISEIFKFYTGDFTKNGSLIDYINKYSEVKVASGTKVNYISYDWNLNEQKK